MAMMRHAGASMSLHFLKRHCSAQCHRELRACVSMRLLQSCPACQATVHARAHRSGPSTRRALSVAELQALHDRLEGGIARLRCLLLDRRVAEAQAEAQARVTQCSVCISAAKDTRLSPCGHLLCRQCSLRVAACPVCRQAVVGRQRAFL